MTGPFHISLFEGTLHADKIHVRLKIPNITHTLPVPVYRQTDFTSKRAVIFRLHDTVARSRTGVRFSPRYNNRGELKPRWLAPAWHFVVVSCKQMQSHERDRSELTPARESPRCHVNSSQVCKNLCGAGSSVSKGNWGTNPNFHFLHISSQLTIYLLANKISKTLKLPSAIIKGYYALSHFLVKKLLLVFSVLTNFDQNKAYFTVFTSRLVA